jgi:predicted MFS family arabinose efflux permease
MRLATTTTSTAGTRLRSPHPWQNLWVRLAVALAFADASIVVLALPQLLDRLHTSVEHVTWVIMGYNLALIVASVAVIPIARRLPSLPVLVAGLAVFGLASIGCGLSNTLSALIPLRCVQGLGGGLILAASLPMFARAARPGDSPLYGWSAAAAIGAAVGPALGGVLEQIFDWRSIFLFQAPVAAFAAVAVLAARSAPAEIPEEDEVEHGGGTLHAFSANVGLTFFSAGLIGALFLVVVELINAWQMTPIAAAAVVTVIPVTTALSERLVRGRSPVVLGAGGALLLAGGLAVTSLASYRQVGLVVVGLALCGIGLGLGFPGLTAAALETKGSATARAAKTVAARDLGIVIGLLLLVPVFVDRINSVASAAENQAAGVVIAAPGISLGTKEALGQKLLAAVQAAPQSHPPNLKPVFRQFIDPAPPAEKTQLLALQGQLESVVQNALTPPFKAPLRYGALLAIAVIPMLALFEYVSIQLDRRRRSQPLSVR